MSKIDHDYSNVVVRHILKDGTEVSTMVGAPINLDNLSLTAKKLLYEMLYKEE